MRYESTIRFLARMWLDIAPMRPTDANFARARAVLRRDDLVNTGIAQDAASGQRPALGNREGLQIILPGESFDIQVLPTVNAQGEDQPMPTFPQFVEQVGAHMAAFARGFEHSAYRLALVREGFLAVPRATMDELPPRLFHVPQPFAVHPPFEWDWRLVSRVPRAVDGVQETLNTAVIVKRASGVFMRPGREEPFDKVRLDMDISTSHERMDARFNPERVQGFFRACLEAHDEVWAQMEEGLQLED